MKAKREKKCIDSNRSRAIEILCLCDFRGMTRDLGNKRKGRSIAIFPGRRPVCSPAEKWSGREIRKPKEIGTAVARHTAQGCRLRGTEGSSSNYNTRYEPPASRVPERTFNEFSAAVN